MTCVRLVFEGRVQGVGFRWFVQREADRLGVAGRVANRPDGGVEAEGEGEAAAVSAWVEAIRQGPPRARVTQVHEQWSEGPRRYRGFQIG